MSARNKWLPAVAGLASILQGCTGHSECHPGSRCTREYDPLASCSTTTCSLSSTRSFDGSIAVGEKLRVVLALPNVSQLELTMITADDYAPELRVSVDGVPAVVSSVTRFGLRTYLAYAKFAKDDTPQGAVLTIETVLAGISSLKLKALYGYECTMCPL